MSKYVGNVGGVNLSVGKGVLNQSNCVSVLGHVQLWNIDSTEARNLT